MTEPNNCCFNFFINGTYINIHFTCLGLPGQRGPKGLRGLTPEPLPGSKGDMGPVGLDGLQGTF